MTPKQTRLEHLVTHIIPGELDPQQMHILTGMAQFVIQNPGDVPLPVRRIILAEKLCERYVGMIETHTISKPTAVLAEAAIAAA